MNFDDLDCRQRDVVDGIVESDDSILVVGGPGTGKTTTALWTARKYLETSEDVPKPRVLFLTFSRSAVSQIMTRSPGVLSGYQDRIEVLTFHSLAYRLLRGFGRYAGRGVTMPSIQSQARYKLLGQDLSKLRYVDLIPASLQILEDGGRIRQLVESRWGLVICDESQDTNAEQWKLLQFLATRKLLLLGDANQMIYTFIPGVSQERFRQIRETSDRQIQLNPRSYRDPSGAIPALAEAIRLRQFGHEAVVDALRSGRLAFHFDATPDSYPDLVARVVQESRGLASRDIGIFARSNAAVAELADQLSDAGIDHVLVGIPEAHAEALTSMAIQCARAVGLATTEELRESLAVFLTSAVRGGQPPEMALALIGQVDLPGLIEQALQQLEEALTQATYSTMENLMEVAMSSWEGIGIRAGYRPWRHATGHFRRLVRSLRQLPVSERAIRQMLEMIEESRIEALIDLDYSERGSVKLMNYHQTKGREADTVIHIFRSDDYFGDEVEPFKETSRLLNVAISRARRRVVIVLPLNLLRPNEIGRELEEYCDSANQGDLEESRHLERKINELRHHIQSYNVPFLALPNNTPAHIALDVFIKTNTTSVRLSAFDIVVAQTEEKTQQSLHELVAVLRSRVPNLDEYEDAESLVLDVACLRQDRPPTRASYPRLDLASMVAEWDELVEGVSWMVEILEEQRVYDDSRLPTITILPVLAALWGQLPPALDELGNALTVVRKYIWRAFLTRRYENSAATRAFQDYRGLRSLVTDSGSAEPPIFDDEQFPLPTIDELMQARWPKSKDILGRGVLAVSLKAGGRDLADGTAAKRSNLTSREYHHLFPRHVLEEDGGLIPQNINLALNCALISWNTNRDISAKDPVVYLRERTKRGNLGLQEIKRRLRSHAVPYEQLSVGRYAEEQNKAVRAERIRADYKAFLVARAEQMMVPIQELSEGHYWPHR